MDLNWALVLILFLACLLAFMFAGKPIAFAFMAVSLIAFYMMMGLNGMKQLVLGMQSQLCNFNFTPIPFFIVMGEVFFQSGLITNTMDSLSTIVRIVPGRLSVITLIGGGIFAALSGSSLANTVMFGSLMMPEMMRRGYSKEMTSGSIIASGALAMIIPPSNQAVMVAGIASISVTGILLGAVGVGVLLIIFYIGYVIVACLRHPEYAPTVEEDQNMNVARKERIIILLKNIVPLVAIFVVVIGIIFSGVGTATEAAAIGALAAYILTIFYRKFSFKLLVNTLISSLKSSAMLMIIIAGSSGFSQVLSFTGASRAAVLAVTSVVSSKVLIIVVMLGIAFIMGLFMEQAAIMMICLPLFMPIVQAYGINEIWFAVLFLILLQIGQFTPPVGMSLFALKGVSPKEVTLKNIIKGVIPFLLINIIVVAIVIIFPQIVTFLPGIAG